MHTSLITTSEARPAIARYVSCLRAREILVLQGSALLGAALALGRPGVEHVAPLAVLTLANLCLVAHVFVVNDLANLTTDRVDPARAGGVFTVRGVAPSEMAGLAGGLLAVSLLLFSTLGVATISVAVGIAALSALYSLPPFNWKSRPLLSSAAHVAGGVLHFLLGYCVAGGIDRRGLATAAFFGLTFAAGHLTQELRDYHADVRSTIRTNAVSYGQRPAFAASLLLFGAAQAVLFTLAVQGVLPRVLAALLLLFPIQLRWSFAALAEGLTAPAVARLQGRYRVLHALIGVAIVAALWLE